MPVYMLCDNGSVRAQATLQLRQLAEQLSTITQRNIHPVSFQHADKISADKLQGREAQVFLPFIQQQLQLGESEFVIIPLFFGFSKALSSFVPDECKKLDATPDNFKVSITQVIYPMPHGNPLLGKIIIDHIHQTAEQHQLPANNCVLVDHGSPVPRVTEVRQHLASSVQSALADGVQLDQAVMERREGKQYDFNGQLLQDYLNEKAQAGARSAIVILMFFLPGRHAGQGGDIEEICDSVMQQYPDFKVAISPLITQHPEFLNILKQRVESPDYALIID